MTEVYVHMIPLILYIDLLKQKKPDFLFHEHVLRNDFVY